MTENKVADTPMVLAPAVRREGIKTSINAEVLSGSGPSDSFDGVNDLPLADSPRLAPPLAVALDFPMQDFPAKIALRVDHDIDAIAAAWKAFEQRADCAVF